VSMFRAQQERQGVAKATCAGLMPKHENEAPAIGNAIVAIKRGCNPDQPRWPDS
jgi:hypothetical protein